MTTMLEPTFELTSEQIEFYRTEGYLAIDALTTPEDIALLCESYDRIFHERAGREEGNHFDLGGTDEEGTEAVLPQIVDPARYAPELNDSLLLANANVLARQLLGDDEVQCSFFHAIFKPARIGAATPWHQDASYWDGTQYYNDISIWVPLQEATLENGCMQFVPRSHQWDVLTHQSINDDPRILGLELHPLESGVVQAPVACPLPAGGATLHDFYMLHHTGPNRTDFGRRALILSAKGKPTPRPRQRRLWWREEWNTLQAERAAQAERNKEEAAK